MVAGTIIHVVVEEGLWTMHVCVSLTLVQTNSQFCFCFCFL